MPLSAFGNQICVAFRQSLMLRRDDEFQDTQLLEEDIPFIQDELDNVTTILYMIIEGARHDLERLEPARQKLCKKISSKTSFTSDRIQLS